MKGFYISKLRVAKKDGKFSEVEFEPGLNVISGASDTGKSFIFSCIDYLLASGSEPEKPPKAVDYIYYYLEVKTYDGDCVTVSRTHGDKSATITDLPLNETLENEISEGEIVQATKAKKGSNKRSLSSLFLNLSGYSTKVEFSKNVDNKKQEISFRDIKKLVLLDEQQVISKVSPFMSGQYQEGSKEKSVFKFSLTGSDDSDLETVESAEVRRYKIFAKIEYIDDYILKLSNEVGEIDSKKDDFKNETETNYEYIFGDLSSLEKQIERLTAQRSDAWSRKDDIEVHISANRQLIKKFELLKDHYSSDLERTDFMLAGFESLNAYDSGKCDCVLCGSDLSAVEDINLSSDFRDAIKTERKKAESNLGDLVCSLSVLEVETEELRKQSRDLNKFVVECDEKIQNELLPIKENLSAKIKNIVSYEKKQSKLSALRREIDKQSNIRESLKLDLTSSKEKASPGQLPKKEIMVYTKYVKTLLKEWNFIDKSSVNFNFSKLDLEIDGQSRGTFGKGKRSLIATACLIALLKYCKKKDLPHPGFVMIDTPLNPYKEGDRKDVSDDNATDDMQDAFYDSLAALGNKMQIIIIENKDPSNTSKMHYEHFSGTKDVGRQGFIVV
jgi:hypothetical protein